MAESTIKLIVDAAGAVSPLKRVTKETEKLDGAVRKANGSLGNTKKKFADAGKGAQSFTKSLGGLKGAILGLGLAALTKRMVGQAASFAETKVRLKALSAEYGEYGRIQQLVEQNAKTFNQSQAESASNFADVFARLRPLGTSLEDIQTVYKGFNATALASGTSAAAASNAFLQLSQALGTGRLQGDEFRSIADQVPGILKLVSDEMKVTVGELKKLGSEGKITSDILINSLAKGFEENKDKIQQLLDESPAQKFKAFGNAVSELSNAVGTELLPVVTPAVEELTMLLKTVGQLPKPIRETGAAILLLTTAAVALTPAIKGIGAALAGITGAGLLAAAPWLALAAGITAAVVALNRYNAAKQPNVQNLKRVGVELTKANKAVKEAQGRLDKETDNTARRSLELAVNSLKDQRQRIVKEFNRLNAGIPLSTPIQTEDKTLPKVIADTGKGGAARGPQDISTAMETLLLRQQQLRFSNDELAQSRIEKEIQIQSILESQSQPRERNIALIEAENDALFRTASIFAENFKKADEANKKITASAMEGVRAGFAAAQEIDAELQEQAQKMNQLYSSIGQTITTGIVDSLTAAVDGTKSLAEVASNTLKSLANILLKFGLQTFLGGLGGGDPNSIFTKLFGGGRANGGSVMSSGSYLVGERGPELFTPGRSGSIAPNGSLGGAANVVVNVDASGTKAEGDGQGAKQLGSAIGAAVQAELIKQQRPGGLLSR